ncbi:hypothetical protein AwWohl_01890 [Gammaproteobacteria bacterium]|nr:hypothetical protein AwWohl_01890 [Gammaproteobacteria bacterium]
MLSFFSWNGRIGRMRYIAWYFGMSLLCMLIPFLFLIFGSYSLSSFPQLPSITFVISALITPMLVISYFSLVFSIQRLHDLNRSGWWVLLVLIPLANLLLGIYMLFFPGSDSNNDHGSIPPANSLGVYILAWLWIASIILFIVAYFFAIAMYTQYLMR